jgi:hypothetical protein
MNKAEPQVLVRITLAIRSKESNAWLQDTGRLGFEQTRHPPCLSLGEFGHLPAGGRLIA